MRNESESTNKGVFILGFGFMHIAEIMEIYFFDFLFFCLAVLILSNFHKDILCL